MIVSVSEHSPNPPESEEMFQAKVMEKKKKTPRKFVKLTLRFFRWALIITFIVFVASGWYKSWSKYLSRQTSVSITRRQSSSYLYPSVTICPGFKEDKNIGKLLQQDENVPENVNQSYVKEKIDQWSFKLTDFVTMFEHKPNDVGDKEAKGVADKLLPSAADQWTTSVLHAISGKCYTYNPPDKSFPGYNEGIRVGLKVPDSVLANKSSQETKEAWLLNNLHIYLHRKGERAFYVQDDFPNSYRVDLGRTFLGEDNGISLLQRTEIALSKENRTCTDKPGYDFNTCVDLKFAKRLGCQPPWRVRSTRYLKVPVCANMTDIQRLFNPPSAIHMSTEPQPSAFKGTPNYAEQNSRRFLYSPYYTSIITSCPMPCTNAIYTGTFAHTSYAAFPKWKKHNNADIVLHFWFKNFSFSFEQEYWVCNWTCLLGELGGNLGFFLGGSILAYTDLILGALMNKVQ